MSADQETDVPVVTRAFDSAVLTRLQEAQTAFLDAKLADSFEKIDLVEGELVKLPRQMEQVREDQVQNKAGGFVFTVSDETRIRRFLILGTASGTYYQSSKELTLENAKAMIDIINAGNAHTILKELGEINAANRNPKMSPLLFVLAITARYHVHDPKKAGADETINKYSKYISEMHRAAFALIPEVCRIPTHLFEFVGYCEVISKSTNNADAKTSTGWGRRMRTAISSWYTTKTAEKLAMFLTKYPQREGWSHRDLFRLAHPVLNARNSVERLELEQIFRYAVKGDLLPRKRLLAADDAARGDIKQYTDVQLDTELNSRNLDLIEAYLKLKHEKSEEVIVAAIKKHGLVREHLPTDSLNSKLVWETLFDVRMPMTALIRNLGKMSLVECLDDARVAQICQRLTDPEELRRTRIHPLTLLIAKEIYGRGRGDKGSLTWNPNKEILKAMEAGFYKSFSNAPVTNKRYCLALDVSGSMCCSVAGSAISCRNASTAMSLVHLHNEPEVKCVAFCDELTELPFTKEWTMQKVQNHIDQLRFGATDCGLPMLWAAEKGLKFDCFIVYTDNDTWAGHVHPFEALQQYREKSGIHDAKLIVMGMTATPFTIADPRDRGMLDISGFDSSVPSIVAEFVMGNI
ncbi:unnamed protein product [Caenorhabditis angaria]|uniref:TROVE domain-containing protein n=1 Tax=Caenorhabditis angaria TaxID=860376 RepID=A0A9P1IV06_9PELO|nr:unnamed protein product [Caenorhabditis angaria]